MIVSSITRAALCTLLVAVPALVSAHARAIEVQRWQPYGAPIVYQPDAGVPGDGALRIEARTVPGEIWSSGAGLPLQIALRAGERVTAAFWARADRQAHVAATIQGGAPGYTALSITGLDLTSAWRRYTITAVAPRDLSAGSQSLTVQAGQARAAVSLGPVAFFRGRPTAAAVRNAFAGFQAGSVAQDIRVASDPGVVLAGTLRTPVGYGSGPFALAILIQGHGPNGRGGFTRLSERLLANGVATLEYDKRGIGGSTGIYQEDEEALTRDAVSWVAAMRKQPEIDGKRIALVGHSQGATIAPAVAASDPQIRALVTFAGPVGDGVDLFRRSMREQLVASGHADATVVPLVEATARLIEARLAGASPVVTTPLRTTVLDGFVANGFTPQQAEGALAVLDRDEIYGIARVRTASDLRVLHIPVLAIFGSLDPLVRVPGNAEAARRALSGNPAARVVVLNGLSHWFQEGAKTGSEAEVPTLGPNLGSPRAVSLAGNWLRDVLSR
jgi:pimeloyl-ACP methyl ester carboxylesterase